MALVPNKFTSSEVQFPIETDDYTETMSAMAVENGYYQAKGVDGGTSSRSSDNEDMLLESKKTILNQLGFPIREDSEEWDYEIYKGPPIEYRRETKSNCYLPGLGRQFRTVEKETIAYWCFSPITDGDNLGRTRFVSAYVVYDRPVTETATTQEEAEKIEEKGMKPGSTRDRIIASGKLWSEANNESRVVEDESANQVAIWVENVITEHDIVEEEIDKWTIWTVKKNSLRPGQVDIDGPRHVKKTGFYYQLGLELEPPKITKAKSLARGVQITVEGGGAEYENKWFWEKIYIVPDLYNIYRAKIAEPPRDESGDKEDYWEPDPPAKEKTKIIGTSATTDQSGAPASPLPPPSGHTEPNDPSEPEEPPETYFTMVGSVENDNKGKWRDKGHAVFLDLDVQTGGEYEYYAEAVYNEQVSPESNHVQVTYIGVNSRTHRLGFRTNPDGSIEIDADAPDDPGVPPPDYGEVEEFEPPAAIDPDDAPDFGDDIATRVFATNEPDFSVNLDVLMPIRGLEYGQAVKMPEVLWQTYGNQLIMSQGTLPERWVLTGFSMSFERDNSGTWTTQRTNLKLNKRAGR